MASLKKAAQGITDGDFRSVHGTHRGPDDEPISGKWGGIRICVGVARKNGVVAIRNTNDPAKTTALCTDKEWQAFVKGVKAGIFD